MWQKNPKSEVLNFCQYENSRSEKFPSLHRRKISLKIAAVRQKSEATSSAEIASSVLTFNCDPPSFIPNKKCEDLKRKTSLAHLFTIYLSIVSSSAIHHVSYEREQANRK